MTDDRLKKESLELIASSKLVFWDFDGVIKDSVGVKGSVFIDIFYGCSLDVKDKINEHHLMNGGMSRYEKIPLYMRWGGIEVTPSRVQQYCHEFSRLSIAKVVSAPWIDGAKEYIEAHAKKQILYIVSATPQQEIVSILKSLKIAHYFTGIVGSPCSKKRAIMNTLKIENILPYDSVFIGDSRLDYESAISCGIPFVLRSEKAEHAIKSTFILPNFS